MNPSIVLSVLGVVAAVSFIILLGIQFKNWFGERQQKVFFLYAAILLITIISCCVLVGYLNHNRPTHLGRSFYQFPI